MRDPKRVEHILGLLSVYWPDHPDLRLGQIISNMAGGTDPFFYEDDKLIESLKTAITQSPVDPSVQVEIIGPSGKMHYRRPAGHPDIDEAFNTPGYSIRRAQ